MRRGPLGVVFLTVFLDLVGFGIVLPLLPRFASEHGALEWQIGLLAATYSLMQFIFAPVWGRLSDRIGRRPVLLFSILGSSISYVIFAFAPSLTLLFVSRAVAGIMAANISTAQAYIADVTTPENRARGMGMIGAAFGLGFIFGPAIAGMGSQIARSGGHNVQMVVGLLAASFSFIDFLMALRRLPESLSAEVRAAASAVTPPGTRVSRMAAALREPSLGLPISLFFLSTVAWSQLEPTIALLCHNRYSLDESQTGYLFAFMGFVVALIQGGFTGRMASRIGEPKMVVSGTLLLCIGFVLVPTAATVPMLAGIMVLLGVGQALTVPGLQSLISRGAARDTQGSTLGVSQGFSSLARVIGPATGGYLFGKNPAYPFWCAAVIIAVAFLLSSRLRTPDAA